MHNTKNGNKKRENGNLCITPKIPIQIFDYLKFTV